MHSCFDCSFYQLSLVDFWAQCTSVSIVQTPGSVALWLICFLLGFWFCFFQIVFEVSKLLFNGEKIAVEKLNLLK